MNSINRWIGECVRKKKLREKWANDIIKRALSEGTKLRKYYCNHCQHWHVTKMSQKIRNKMNLELE